MHPPATILLHRPAPSLRSHPLPSCLPLPPLQVLEEVSPVAAAEGVIAPEVMGSSGIDEAKDEVARWVGAAGEGGACGWAGGHYMHSPINAS